MINKKWELYPNLIVEILEYFNISNRKDELAKKSVFGFVNSNLLKNNTIPKYQPDLVDFVCERLNQQGILNCLKYEKGMSYGSNYLYIPKSNEFFQKGKAIYNFFLNSLVYGFEYIYDNFKSNVIPIVYRNSNYETMGTCFRYATGIVTAKHCVLDVEQASILGYSAEILNNSNIYIHDNENIDIVYIDTKSTVNDIILSDNASVLDEVIVMGFPRIPTFTDFITAELATVSSRARARLTPTKGSIAAEGKQYTANIETLLITAKIMGGNSGGPVINDKGCIVGVACQTPYYGEDIGNYDDLGYGIVIPIKYVNEIIQRKNRTLELKDNFFVDYN